MSSAHTPYVVVQIGIVSPDGILYRHKDGERPVYDRYATGKLDAMVELANNLNYQEAERNGMLAVAETPQGPFEEEPVGIPTPLPPEVRLDAVRVALNRADAGKINLVEFKRRVDAALNSEDLIG